MIISIDIGTSYCSGCFLMPDGTVQPIEIGTGSSMFGSKYAIPSAIYVEENGKVLVGQAAMNSRKRNPQNFRMEFKRDLGSSIPILLGERSFLPEDIYTELFRHIRLCAEAISREPIEKVCLTYPASYGSGKRKKLCSAARAAGFFEVTLVDEPAAAAMCHCAEGYVHNGEQFLIYDFGGGTFDASLIRYEGGVFTPLCESEGLEQCGGIDMDRLIYQDILRTVDAYDAELLPKLRQDARRNMLFASRLSEMAVKCKHHLSSANVFSDDIPVEFDIIPYELTLDRFEEMIRPMVGKTIQTCQYMLEDAELSVSQLSGILLVGGTSRVPLVQKLVGQFAGTVPVHSAADQELTVAKGALSPELAQVQTRFQRDREQLLNERRMAEEARIRQEIRQQLEQEQAERRRQEEEQHRREEELRQQKERELQRRREEEARRRAEEECRRREAEEKRRREAAERERIANTPLMEIRCRINKEDGTLQLCPAKMIFLSETGTWRYTIYNRDIAACQYTRSMAGSYWGMLFGVVAAFGINLASGYFILELLTSLPVGITWFLMYVSVMWYLVRSVPAVRWKEDDGKQRYTVRRVKRKQRKALLQYCREHLPCQVTVAECL